MFLNTRSFKRDSQTAVEVEFWEGYLFRDRSGLQSTLCTYSLDNGPLPGVQPATLVFRFTDYDWNKNIRHLLEHHNIHYCVLRKIAINSMHQL